MNYQRSGSLPPEWWLRQHQQTVANWRGKNGGARSPASASAKPAPGIGNASHQDQHQGSNRDASQ